VSSSFTATLTAHLGGASQTATLTVLPPSVSILVATPPLLQGGQSSTGIVFLTGPAGSSGDKVTLTSTKTAVVVPAFVTVPANETAISFPITTTGVSAATWSTVKATFNNTSQTVIVEVVPAALSSLVLTPSPVYGDSTSTGTITLAGPAGASGNMISLSSGNANATVPSSVTTAGGATSAAFTIHTSVVSVPVYTTITAKFGTVSKTAVLEVLPAPLANLILSPASLVGGSQVTATVYLNGNAGPSGNLVKLSANSSAVTLPSTVTVPSGTNKLASSFSTHPVSANTVVTVTATFVSVTKTATFTVTVPPITGLSLTETTVTGTAGTTGTVQLGGAAGPSGAVVHLSSNNAHAAVPATVTVSSGSTSTTFNVTTTAVTAKTTVTITATYGASTKTVTLTLNANG
jgi:hypothetical protein